MSIFSKEMSEPIKTVLMSCGSFNPITNMHLRMFELAKDQLSRQTQHQVVEGIISPTHDTYETSKRLESAVHRCQMARLALTSIFNQPNWVRVDDWESTQNRWYPTREVMNHYYQQLNDPNVSLKLLCGADLFHTFNVPDLWKDEDIHQIVGKYGLVVVTREGSDPIKTLEESQKSPILRQYKDNIFIVTENISNQISSTAIRNAIANNESIRYLTPDPVIEYIKANNLYKF